MEEKILYQIRAQYRDDFRIRGYVFGSGAKALAVVGSTRGNEHQQMFVCAQLIARLKEMERKGNFAEGKEVLVIPCANPYSMNIRKRFWSIDNTDINRMFPGYDQGETTQRIAAGIFQAIQGYEVGVQMASFYMRGSFAPHIRIMRTGFEDISMAGQFGLDYVILRQPRPFDTTTLNYNWQIWNTRAFSMYTTNTEFVNRESAALAVDSILHFMKENGILKKDPFSVGEDKESRHGEDEESGQKRGRESLSAVRRRWNPRPRVVTDDDILTIRAEHAGFFESETVPGESVKAGRELARITDCYDSHVLETITAPADGTVLFAHSEDICCAKSAVYKLIRAGV